MAIAVHGLPQATGDKCEPAKEPLTASSLKFNANFSVPQILAPSSCQSSFWSPTAVRLYPAGTMLGMDLTARVKPSF